MSEQPIITKSRSIQDLRAIGLSEGRTVMLHVSVKAIGWIVGGVSGIDSGRSATSPGTRNIAGGVPSGGMYDPDSCPQVDELQRTVIRLPVDQRYTDEDIEQTVAGVRKVWSRLLGM